MKEPIVAVRVVVYEKDKVKTTHVLDINDSNITYMDRKNKKTLSIQFLVKQGIREGDELID